MMMQHDVLRTVFRQTFELAADAETDNLAYRAIPAWDSIGHMRLIAAIETEFNIMLDTDEVLDLSSFAKALEIIGRYVS
ncbi:MAG: acyl carrier protein [Magnetospirillum sp.]|nr:acyl carrier protein [Magnetospirillum sp.]